MVNVKMKTTVTMKVSGQGVSHSRADVAVRDLAVSIDEPVARGGTNLGPAPTETALAAFVGCTNVIGHKCADKLGLDIGQLNVEIACDFDRRGVTLAEEIDVPFKAIRQTVVADGPVSEADLQRLGTEVARFCPLSKLFEQAGTQIETTWMKA